MTNKSILLIDDDDDLLRVLTTRCESIGLAVEQTRNLLTATLKIAKHVPDIICTDVQMPTGNGLSFCQALASDPETSHIAIVVLTGKTDAETQHDCQRLKATYVEKNVDYWSQLEPILRQLASDTTATIPVPACLAAPRAIPMGSVRPISKIEVQADARIPAAKKIVLSVFLLGMVGCAEKATVTKETEVSTPGGTTKVTVEEKITQTGDNPPAVQR